MFSFANMQNTYSCTDGKASALCAANFSGYTYGRLITVSTAAAVLIFIVPIINALIGYTMN